MDLFVLFPVSYCVKWQFFIISFYIFNMFCLLACLLAGFQKLNCTIIHEMLGDGEMYASWNETGIQYIDCVIVGRFIAFTIVIHQVWFQCSKVACSLFAAKVAGKV